MGGRHAGLLRQQLCSDVNFKFEKNRKEIVILFQTLVLFGIKPLNGEKRAKILQYIIKIAPIVLTLNAQTH